MFYDAHYLFPRPWTQEQAAPGVPQDAPLAFYGQNRVSQPFISGHDNLSMVEIWLAGEPNEIVTVSLTEDQNGARFGKSQDVVFSGQLALEKGREGGDYRLSFPPVAHAQGRRFLLTMAALDATVDLPVVTRTVGGDRLGGSLQLNEYNRPGNLVLKSYARGWPGIWWFEAMGEQLLPSVFRLRLQQYKPDSFKGVLFPVVLVLTAALSIVYLVLARPQERPSLSSLIQALGWTSAIILGLFLLWQISSRRVILPFFNDSNALVVGGVRLEEAPLPGTGSRLIRDIISDLWTLKREPEARFVSSELVNDLPGLRVPSDSAVNFALNIPPDTIFKAGVAAEGNGRLRAEVQVNGEAAKVQEIIAVDDPGAGDISWFDVDLSPWSGQEALIRLVTNGEQSKMDSRQLGNDRQNAGLEGLWIMPQIESKSSWILPDPLPPSVDIRPANYQFGESIELLGYSVRPSNVKPDGTASVDLYWRPTLNLPIDVYATVFVHLIDADGNLVAQHDGQPVNNAYPLPVWQPGTIIHDSHQLVLPSELPAGEYSLMVGLYDPVTLQRWPVVGMDSRLRGNDTEDAGNDQGDAGNDQGDAGNDQGDAGNGTGIAEYEARLDWLIEVAP